MQRRGRAALPWVQRPLLGAGAAIGLGLRPERRERLLELLIIDLARAVRVKRIEESVQLLLGRCEAKRRHRLAELLLANAAIAVVVPTLEQVKDPHGVLGQELAQLLLHRGARVWIKLYRRFERSPALPLTVLGILLAQRLGRRRFD